jgi:hypothetical protein
MFCFAFDIISHGPGSPKLQAGVFAGSGNGLAQEIIPVGNRQRNVHK